MSRQKYQFDKLKAFLLGDMFSQLKPYPSITRQQDFEYLEWINSDLVRLAADFYEEHRLAEGHFIRSLNAAFKTDRFENLFKRWLVEYLHKFFGVLHACLAEGRPTDALGLEDNHINRFALKKFYERFKQQPSIRWIAPRRPAYLSAMVSDLLVLFLSLKNGLRVSSGRKRYKVLRESVWGLRDVRGEYFHDDFIVDGKMILPEDLLLFSRGVPTEPGRKKGYQDARQSPYGHFNLQRLSMGIKTFRERILPLYLRSGHGALAYATPGHGSLFFSVFLCFLKYAVPYEKIFSHFEIGAELGHNYFSVNHVAEAIVCQAHRTRYYLMHWSDNSVGIDQYLLSFLGCDAFLLWGRSHIQGVEGPQEILRPIGYVFKKFIFEVKSRRHEFLGKMGIIPRGKVVSFFDESFGGECKMTEAQYVHFWRMIYDVAVRHAGHTVVIKPKDLSRFEQLSETYREQCLALYHKLAKLSHVHILDPLKWSFIEAIGVSDLVVTQGMTSSATIALICGIPGLYLDEAGYDHPLRRMFYQQLVFNDPANLLKQIDVQLDDPGGQLNVVPENVLREFDAFDDDKALERLRETLIGEGIKGNFQKQSPQMVGIIVQARMGSTRLPGKIMKPVLGRPMLDVLIERLRRCEKAKVLIVATTTAKQDDRVEEFCRLKNVACFRGSEEDVLGRYYRAAQSYHLDVVVRITSDCPLMDPGLVDELVESFLKGPPADIVSNTVERTFPRGFDIEIFSFETLQKAFEQAREPHEREHVTPFIYKHLKSRNFSGPSDESRYRVTVDTPEDYDLILKIFDVLKGRENFGYRDVVDVLRTHPQWVAINEKVIQKSLR